MRRVRCGLISFCSLIQPNFVESAFPYILITMTLQVAHTHIIVLFASRPWVLLENLYG